VPLWVVNLLQTLMFVYAIVIKLVAVPVADLPPVGLSIFFMFLLSACHGYVLPHLV
jgi:hypothetical protein